MKYSNIILSSLLLGGVVINCGGGGKDIYAKKDFKGVVTDGYISGADIEVYYSKSTAKTKSNSRGEYSVKISSNADIITIEAIGGIDDSTDELYEGHLRSIVSSDERVYTTPLTTLISNLIESGEKEEKTRNRINNSLGIDIKINLFTQDPMSRFLSLEDKADIFKATQQVQKVSEIIKDVLGADISYMEISKSISKSILNDKIKDVLISDRFRNNLLAFVPSSKRNKALSKMQVTKKARISIIDVISKASFTRATFDNVAKSIELTSETYEAKVKEIGKAIDKGLTTEKLTMDLNGIIETFKDLDKTRSFMKRSIDFAASNNKTISIPKLSQSIIAIISTETGIDLLTADGLTNLIENSAMSAEDKEELNKKIEQGLDVVFTGSGVSTSIPGSGSSGSSGGSGSTTTIITPPVTERPNNEQLPPDDTNANDIVKRPDEGPITIPKPNDGGDIPSLPR